MSLPRVLKDLIEHFEGLPGIGPRSAARLAYFLLRAPETKSTSFAKTLANLRTEIKVCEKCFNYAESSICDICDDTKRDSSVLLIVEEPLDVIAFERSNIFNGIYHVLGGVISPVNGIGPEEIRIEELLNRFISEEFEEIIIATNPNLEGESTALYIKNEIMKDDKLTSYKVTRLARGLPTGADLEYADNVTLQKAFEGRDEF